MLEVKWEPYDEQDSYFYVPPKPKDYYISKGVWENTSPQSSKEKGSYNSGLADFLGMLTSPKGNKR